ncbi:Type I secretion system, membrane fusion protein LapC [hydrothermal vent metagenome]|uniref:Type I secretion system, membrane fusion protein LapC n=1 Tax=hydrothermal vent metagenome TaxID=652676 RepID=A0A1W1D440_9ZZZZ
MAKYSQEDLEYMNSLSAAIKLKSPIKSTIILWVSFFAIMWLLFWASHAQVDEITKGQGKVIPSGQVKVVQNLEGGIVSEILVKEGQHVHKGDILFKLDNTISKSSYKEQKLKINELRAKAIRLKAQINMQPFSKYKKEYKNIDKKVIRNERNLYRTNIRQLSKTLHILLEQVEQKKYEYANLKDKIKNQTENYNLIQEQIKISKPLYEKQIISKVEYLKLIREANKISAEIQSLKLSLPKIKSEIKEAKQKIIEEKLKFKNKSSEEYNKVTAQIDQILQKTNALSDKVKRTIITSPVDGVIKQLFINTIGGVVKPAMDICEIVPSSNNLIIETKIKPSDIAFLYPNQKAIVKFTAYDFTIHGGLEGRVVNIGADTIVDKKGNSFFNVKIKTDKNYLGTPEKKLYIMVGMTAEVDILTGKKTVLDYILKPIFKAKNSALTER